MLLMEYILKHKNTIMKEHHLISINFKDTNKVCFVVDKDKFEKTDVLYWNRIIDNIRFNWDVLLLTQKEWNLVGYEEF